MPISCLSTYFHVDYGHASIDGGKPGVCSCKMYIDPLGDHVLTCKQHTGSIRGHNHLMDVVASVSRDSKIGPVRVNHKVSTTGDGTRKQGD